MGKRALGSQYFLHEQIGRGGMGTVWRGEDQVTGASYAIKVLNESFASDPGAVARFVRERTALISFRHPHVVQVHDMIVERDTLALVMDLVPGGDLNRLRREHGGRLSVGHAAQLVAQVADALAAAHAAGIVHRDVKPANILLRADDDALLADFGIAQLAAQSGDTPTGMVLGTAEYLAPELIAGGEAGPEGDLYSLGVTLYQLVAGAPPFTGHPGAVLHAHIADEPARPPGMDDGLWEIVRRCLRKNPAERPSAASLASDLHGLAPTMPATRVAPASPLAAAGPLVDQYGLSSPLKQVRMEPLSAVPEPGPTRPRRTLPSLSSLPSVSSLTRQTLAITAGVAAGVILIAAVALADPFGSSAAKNTSDQLAAPTVTSGASAAAATSAGPSGAGHGKQQGSPAASGTRGATGAGPSSSKPATAGSAGTAGTRPSSGGSGTSPTSSPTATGTPDADGFSILDASDGDDARTCEQLGIDRRGYQAMVCFEIDSYAMSGGHYLATGKVEAYCQTIAGAMAQCLQITLGGLFTEGVAGTENQQSWSCGGSGAACPAGGLVETLTTYEWPDSSSDACNNGTSPANDVWDEVDGGTTQIELPVSEATYQLTSGDGANDGDNYSSGHYWVCQF